jgi:glyoxylase-like metal-dependent hydrolase (beta-lactamase superfamily II)
LIKLYPGADLLECEINGRPLYLPLLREGQETVLIDCGTRQHAEHDVPLELERLGVRQLTRLIVTHPDGDHCGGSAETKKRHPGMRIACGALDRDLIESPDDLYRYRYDAFRSDHGIFFDAETEKAIRACSSDPQKVDQTFRGGETLGLGPERILEIWHLPGHSRGHLGVYDRKFKTLFYGDAIQGRGYQSLAGGWALCPTYLYVAPYLETIRKIEDSDLNLIVGCHWPIRRDRPSILEFCAESRHFVEKADRLIRGFLSAEPRGATLTQLCEQLSSKLGDWPPETALELANAFSGHLAEGIEEGAIELDASKFPFRYQWKRPGASM